jgi:salicylate hydroxylase
LFFETGGRIAELDLHVPFPVQVTDVAQRTERFPRAPDVRVFESVESGWCDHVSVGLTKACLRKCCADYRDPARPWQRIHLNGTNVIIVGGGIGGLTAALACAERGFDVTVLEQAASFGAIGAGIQLSPNATRVLHALGLDPALRRVAFVPEGTEVRHWRKGNVLSANPLADAALQAFGFPYYHIHRADLMAVLEDAARARANIVLVNAARVEHVDHDERKATVTTTAGNRHRGDVLIGADGIHSVVRSALFGPEAPTFTGNVAWRALVPVERLPADLVRPMATVWWGPHKHFVHYYVRGGALVNCVCVVEKRGWETESWTARGEHAELAADFTHWHDTVQTLIDRMDRDACFKWALFDRPPMPRWGDRRVSLLGDACHPTLPFMAQGAAMAIEDAAVLAACLAGDPDSSRALARYEERRRSRTRRIQEGSRRNAKIFHMTGVQAWFRNRAARHASGRMLDWVYGYDALSAAEGP